MNSRRLHWRIYVSFLVLVSAPLIGITWYFSHSARDLLLEQASADLQARVLLAVPEISRALIERPVALDSVCDELGGPTATRITVIRPDGTVLADTHEDPSIMTNHADRPEFMEALKGKLGSSTRYSHTLHERMMYVAIPVYQHGEIVAGLRVAVSISGIEESLGAIQMKIAFGLLLALALAAIVGLWIAKHFSRPLEELRRGADRFARGELQSKIRASGSLEVEELAEAMNHMAAQLDNYIAEVVSERNEREAILSSMVEGVIAVDADESILSINQTAARWFGVGGKVCAGLSVQEAIRNSDLQRFVGKTLDSEGVVEGELELAEPVERSLQAHGAPLYSANNERIGVVIALHDVTQLRKLERMRSDFVANVSHELKTPITSIKGFVETLLSEENLPEEERARFLQIVARQSDRLNEIIEDLLTISRLEHEEKVSPEGLRPTRLISIVRSAVESCKQRAKQRNVRIVVDCPDDLSVPAEPHLLEQALVNLVDNAIKYGPENSEVLVTVERNEGAVKISVADSGPGIEPRHLPRLFERFYRVDKARVRKLGGTGLGLSIVKHIAQLHGGTVSVSSEPGRGSVFTITLYPPPSGN